MNDKPDSDGAVQGAAKNKRVGLFPAVGNPESCPVTIEVLSVNTVSLKWDIAAGSHQNPDVITSLTKVIDNIFSDPAFIRVVTLVKVGDFPNLSLGRRLGFVAEGIERSMTETGQVQVFWRSSLLRGEGKDTDGQSTLVDPKTIDGSRPAHLVSEFHDVYGMPNSVEAATAPTVDFERLDMRMSLVKEEFAELCGAIYGPAAEQALLETYPTLPDEGQRDVVEAADALADLVYVIYGMALESGIDLDQVLAEVHRSNLSKLMPDGTVLRREDGKILKGPNFSEPRIGEAIGSHDISGGAIGVEQ